MSARLEKYFGYEHGVAFPRARDALYCYTLNHKIKLPTNICEVAADSAGPGERVSVNPLDGLAPIPVHLYGYRVEMAGELSLDPLMTGWFDGPRYTSAIISFGRNKMIDLGGGGLFLTNDKSLAEEMRPHGFWPYGLWGPLWKAIDAFPDQIKRRFDRIALWDRHLGDSCFRIPREQIMPWRVIRRIPMVRDRVVLALRNAGFDAGTNYPPLPGVTDPGAISWGREVINFFVSDDYDEPRIKAACEIIKRTVAP